ncbi:MAG: hypothetical protein V3U35_00210 [Candidatus Neomarinimicrobiota bacterium]
MLRRLIPLLSSRGAVLLAVGCLLAVALPGQVRPPGRDRVTLFVLDFDNLQGDPRLEWLTRALKDMILLRLEEEPRVAARDAGDISPFLGAREREGRREPPTMASNTLILMGGYRREGARLLIDLQLLDVDNWTSLDRRPLEALYSDIPQLNLLLAAAVTEMVKGVTYFSGINLRAPPDTTVAPPVRLEESAYAPALEYARRVPQAQEDLAHALDDLEAAMDAYSGYVQPPSGTFQEGGRYYRDFSLEGHGTLPVEKARHTALFEDVLARVADNPYSAELGELSLAVDPYDDDRVYISIPVTYRVKQTLMEDMLTSLPYVATREERNLRTIRYDKSSFSFSTNLIDRIARGDFRVMPVVQLRDSDDGLRAVLVDSPDMSWERYFPRSGVTTVRQRRFIPLLAVTTSGFSVDVRMETDVVEVFYELDLDVAQLPSHARVEVQFIKESELLRFLQAL